jgi:thioredoxin-related protein
MRIIGVLFFLVTSSLTMVAGDSTTAHGNLPWQSFNNGFADAKKSGKKVMVDVYTDWCGWCKRLDKDVYGNASVAAYLRDHFVLVKLNPETNTTVKYKDTSYAAGVFAQGFGITGYPTILFFEPGGEPIDRLGGYVPAEKFLPIIKFIGEDFYKKMSWDDFQKSQAPVPPK